MPESGVAPFGVPDFAFCFGAEHPNAGSGVSADARRNSLQKVAGGDVSATVSGVRLDEFCGVGRRFPSGCAGPRGYSLQQSKFRNQGGFQDFMRPIFLGLGKPRSALFVQTSPH